MASNIMVGEPVSFALSRTGEVLFRPFQFNKWLAIGLAAALTLLGEGGTGFSFPSGGGGGGGPRGAARGPAAGPSFDQVLQWIRDHILLIAGIALPVILILFLLYLLVRWLNCRGQFMFFDNVVNNDDRIKAPWSEFREIANSLFKFRIVWDLVCFNIFLLNVIITGLIIWPDVSHALAAGNYTVTGWTIGAIIFAVISFPLAAIAIWIPSSVIFHMAVPVMFIRRSSAWATIKYTWRELFLPNVGACLLYFLMMIVVRVVEGFWAAIGLLIVIFATCCTAYCLVLIPGVGIYLIALLSLPVLTFERAFKLRFISQFGPDFQVNWQTTPRGAFPVILNEAPPIDSPPPPPSPPIEPPQV